MDLKKFKSESDKLKLSETSVWLLKKFKAMHEGLKKELNASKKRMIRYSGRHTTTGGTATEEVPLQGIKSSMKCSIQMRNLGATPVSVKACRCENDKLVIEFSADPSTDHVLEYLIYL